MLELEPLRVKHQPPGVRARTAITRVAHEGGAYRGEVNPDLMLASGDRLRFDQESVRASRQNPDHGRRRDSPTVNAD